MGWLVYVLQGACGLGIVGLFWIWLLIGRSGKEG